MSDPKVNVVPTIPRPRQFEFAKRPYPPVKPECLLVETEIAAIRADDRMYTDHIHEWFDHPLHCVGHEGVGTVSEQVSATDPAPADEERPAARWRLALGTALFLISIIGPFLFVPLVAMLGFSAGLAAVANASILAGAGVLLIIAASLPR